jgi:hypothetical protein
VGINRRSPHSPLPVAIQLSFQVPSPLARRSDQQCKYEAHPYRGNRLAAVLCLLLPDSSARRARAACRDHRAAHLRSPAPALGSHIDEDRTEVPRQRAVQGVGPRRCLSPQLGHHLHAHHQGLRLRVSLGALTIGIIRDLELTSVHHVRDVMELGEGINFSHPAYYCVCGVTANALYLS